MAHNSHTPNIVTSYLRNVMDGREYQDTVDKTIETAMRIKAFRDFDTLVFSGVSGAAMGFTLAYNLKVHVLVVRKDTDSSHFFPRANKTLEGNVGTNRYLIVDDFISGGGTVARILSDVAAQGTNDPQCVGLLQYGGGLWSGRKIVRDYRLGSAPEFEVDCFHTEGLTTTPSNHENEQLLAMEPLVYKTATSKPARKAA